MEVYHQPHHHVPGICQQPSSNAATSYSSTSSSSSSSNRHHYRSLSFKKTYHFPCHNEYSGTAFYLWFQVYEGYIDKEPTRGESEDWVYVKFTFLVEELGEYCSTVLNLARKHSASDAIRADYERYMLFTPRENVLFSALSKFRALGFKYTNANFFGNPLFRGLFGGSTSKFDGMFLPGTSVPLVDVLRCEGTEHQSGQFAKEFIISNKAGSRDDDDDDDDDDSSSSSGSGSGSGDEQQLTTNSVESSKERTDKEKPEEILDTMSATIHRFCEIVNVIKDYQENDHPNNNSKFSFEQYPDNSVCDRKGMMMSHISFRFFPSSLFKTTKQTVVTIIRRR